MLRYLITIPTLATALTLCAAPPPASDVRASPGTWNAIAAAKYLDGRQVWWQEWPHAQKDHGTVCVSCHTQVPYALARPMLRGAMDEHGVSEPERAMLDSIMKRVKLGNEAETFYSDAEHGPGKTKEARNAEAVNNALILSSYDAARAEADAKAGVVYRTAPPIHVASREAFAAMWTLQERTGPKAGAWLWQNFHFSPWEAPESEYYGAAMAALAVGMAPDGYRAEKTIAPNLELLRGYLRREAAAQPLINRVALLWASSKLDGLMTGQEREAVDDELTAKQHADGGWSLTDLGMNAAGQSAWKRHDESAFDMRSDGYATGIVVLALEENGLGKSNVAGKAVVRGLAWIEANQSKADGRWQAWSVNVKRDPESQVGKFMSDAATGFSILALEHSR